MTQPPSRPEARSRFGSQTASELGAPVASSIPEQLPGHEPASARKGYEDGNAFVWRNRRVEGSFGRHGLARGAMLFGVERHLRLGKAGRTTARLLDCGDRHRGERRLRARRDACLPAPRWSASGPKVPVVGLGGGPGRAVRPLPWRPSGRSSRGPRPDRYLPPCRDREGDRIELPVRPRPPAPGGSRAPQPSELPVRTAAWPRCLVLPGVPIPPRPGRVYARTSPGSSPPTAETMPGVR